MLPLVDSHFEACLNRFNLTHSERMSMLHMLSKHSPINVFRTPDNLHHTTHPYTHDTYDNAYVMSNSLVCSTHVMCALGVCRLRMQLCRHHQVRQHRVPCHGPSRRPCRAPGHAPLHARVTRSGRAVHHRLVLVGRRISCHHPTLDLVNIKSVNHSRMVINSLRLRRHRQRQCRLSTTSSSRRRLWTFSVKRHHRRGVAGLDQRHHGGHRHRPRIGLAGIGHTVHGPSRALGRAQGRALGRSDPGCPTRHTLGHGRVHIGDQGHTLHCLCGLVTILWLQI